MQAIPNHIRDSILSTPGLGGKECLLLNTSVTKIQVDVNAFLSSTSQQQRQSDSGQVKISPKYIVHTTQQVHDGSDKRKVVEVKKQFEADNVVIATDSPSALALM
jgi:hypothetical protein